MDIEEGKLKLRTLPWAEARLSHAAAVAAANWDRPQVYVKEIKGIWTQDILDAHRERQLESKVLQAFRKEALAVPEPKLEAEAPRPGPPRSQGLRWLQASLPPGHRTQSGPMQNNFMRSSFVGSGNYGWAVQRLSRAAALAAVHWKNPKAYRAELCGRKDPEDEREEEIQIRVLGKMGGESLSVSLRESASRRDASHRFEDGWRPQDQGDIMLTELEPLREETLPADA
ncbi:unnamed protein product [Effrenium voratum]|uniref:Uncharacterized protein n=1 Tax=Effrenium voratum TaxID=2562239 RepID=A0AA36HQ47_9DINO|nr:unnamed protein product [Effrenium voratum]